MADMTNYERIKSMSVEEMATAILNGISSDQCDYCNYSNGYCNGEWCKNKADVNCTRAESSSGKSW